MLFARLALMFVLALGLVVASASARDRDRNRNRDIDAQDGPAESPPQVVEARNNLHKAYQEGNYARAIELASWLISNYPNDNVHVAYHMRASAKIEQGRNTR